MFLYQYTSSELVEFLTATLRPSPKARASFPAAAPEGTAGKKKRRRGGAAARRVKLARAEASAAEPPTDQARARLTSPMFLGALSPTRGSSRSQRSASASSRASRREELEPRRVTWADQLVDELDAKMQGRTLPGSFFSKQKASLKAKGRGKQKGKSSKKGKQQNAKGKSKGKNRDRPQASPAGPGAGGE